MSKSEKTEVSVPQKDGEIVISVATAKTRYKVTDHRVEVDDSDLARFCRAVDGAQVVKSTKSRDLPGKSKPDSPESKDGHPSHANSTSN